MEKVSERVAQLLQCMNERIYGKEQVVALALLSAVAGVCFCSALRVWQRVWWREG